MGAKVHCEEGGITRNPRAVYTGLFGALKGYSWSEVPDERFAPRRWYERLKQQYVVEDELSNGIARGVSRVVRIELPVPFTKKDIEAFLPSVFYPSRARELIIVPDAVPLRKARKFLDCDEIVPGTGIGIFDTVTNRPELLFAAQHGEVPSAIIRMVDLGYSRPVEVAILKPHDTTLNFTTDYRALMAKGDE
jgi:hypothetical protein